MPFTCMCAYVHWTGLKIQAKPFLSVSPYLFINLFIYLLPMQVDFSSSDALLKLMEEKKV